MTRAAVLAVRVTPRAGRDVVDGVGEDGELRVRVAAPPVNGAANTAAARLLARELGLPRGSVAVVAGASSRHKRISVSGVAAARLIEIWPGVSARDA